VIRAQPGLKAQSVRKAPPERRVPKVSKVRRARKDLLVRLVRKVIPVLRDRLVQEEGLSSGKHLVAR
jgi:hypothetical protein